MKKFLLSTILCFTALSTLHAQQKDDEYIDGTFIVNEDWYTHQNSTVNWISNDGEWTYRVFQKANPGHELGATTQYGTIYGENFYLISKQEKDPGATVMGSRFAICDARTMKLKKEFRYIATKTLQGHNGQDSIVSIADGRSFLAVDNQKGYIGTNNGIWLYDMDNMRIGKQIERTENPNSEGYGQLYHAQIGTMLRKDEYVYAVHQQYGLLIIDPLTDQVVKTLQAPYEQGKQRGFGSIVMSKDGNLWLSVAADQTGSGATVPYIFKFNPTTCDTIRIYVPNEFYPPANSWYAWTPDGFCSSAQSNVLYWNGGTNSWFSNSVIIKYDIDNNIFSKFIDLKNTGWYIYGCSFRIDPVTDEAYISLFHNFSNPTYILRKYDNTGNILAEYPMISQYWFPSLPVFPDNNKPVAHEMQPVQQGYQPFVISLTGIATDTDNMEAAMVKTIAAISDERVLTATIINGDLSVSPKGIDGNADITLNINSNGQTVQTVVSISIRQNTRVGEESIIHSVYYYNGVIHMAYCKDFNFMLFDINGTAVKHFVVKENQHSERVTELSRGNYILKGSNGKKNITAKIVLN